MLMSFFGLHRRRRGAIAGHLAVLETTSSEPMRRYAAGLRRLGFGEDATRFFDEHVEADSVHENIAAYDMAQGLAVAEPDLTADILFGARALLALDGERDRAVRGGQRDLGQRVGGGRRAGADEHGHGGEGSREQPARAPHRRAGRRS